MVDFRIRKRRSPIVTPSSRVQLAIFLCCVHRTLMMYLEEHLEGVCMLLMMHSDFNPSSPVPQRKKSLLDGQFSQPLSWLGWIFPKLFCNYICFRVVNRCCLRKGSVEGSPNYSLHLSPKWLLLHKNYLEGSVNWALHDLRVSSCGQNCVNCWHVSTRQIQSAENDPSCLCCWGILSIYFAYLARALFPFTSFHVDVERFPKF